MRQSAENGGWWMVEGERGDGGWGLGNPPIQKGGFHWSVILSVGLWLTYAAA